MVGILLQGTTGATGNFELVVPRKQGGGAWHWWRDNDDPGLQWHGPGAPFGCSGLLTSTAAVETSYGNLEVLANESGHLCHVARVTHQGNHVWLAPVALPGPAAPGGGVGFVQSLPNPGTAHGNFEVVAPLAAGGMGHWWRDNSHPGLPWHGPTPFGTGTVDAVALLQLHHNGQLAAIARSGDALHHWQRDPAGLWHHLALIGGDAAGTPDVAQVTQGAQVDGAVHLQLVSPMAGGGFGHWWCDAPADGSAPAWHFTTAFGAGPALTAGLIQSSFGNLEAVGVHGDHLEHWWREATHPFQWFGPHHFWNEAQFVASQQGTCEVLYDTGTVAIHAALLRTGKVLVWSYDDHDASVPQAHVIDVATTQTQKLATAPHAFCSGLATTPGGKVVASGGHHFGVGQVHSFDPDSGTWTFVAEMTVGRWYPTQTCLPDGRISTMSGSALGGPTGPGNPCNDTIQFWDDGAGALSPPVPFPQPWSAAFPPSAPAIGLYPFVYVLPQGDLFVHARHVSRRYDWAGDAWGSEIHAASPVSRTYPGQGSSVLLCLEPPGYEARVLIVGGGGTDPELLTGHTPAVATAEILDLSAADPQWRPTGSMAFPRVMPDAVLLPDGSVVVCGGSASGRSDDGGEPVFPIERFDPATETWTTMCDIAVPRLYHATALLLPDARVLMMGKDGIFQPPGFQYPEHRGEVFSPPYLFAGPRPAIAASPTQVAYGQAFQVSTPDAAHIDAARIARPGAVTHSFNHEQRLVGLAIGTRSSGKVKVTAPPNANVAPPGWYLLYLLAGGVPSVATWIRIG